MLTLSSVVNAESSKKNQFDPRNCSNPLFFLPDIRISRVDHGSLGVYRRHCVFLGLNQTYRLALKLQRKIISVKHPNICQFARRSSLKLCSLNFFWVVFFLPNTKP
ncbi:hypothetical protein K1719_002336 [Acacia pycnantha]|nr:hypothetical protein K1719_002336 [Acacia pycnantha]